MESKMLIAGALATAALLGTAGAAGASEPPANAESQFVTGSYSTLMPEGLHTAISAHNGPNGPSGQVTSRIGDDTAHGRVVCLLVDGNQANVEVQVTRSTNPDMGEPGQFANLSFIDGGPPRFGQPADMVAGIGPHDQPIGCGNSTDYFPFVLASGNIVVSDGS
jgi:hypothetical protein